MKLQKKSTFLAILEGFIIKNLSVRRRQPWYIMVLDTIVYYMWILHFQFQARALENLISEDNLLSLAIISDCPLISKIYAGVWIEDF